MQKEREKLCFACPATYPASYSSCPRCQLPLVFPVIGHTWVVEGLLGRGGMGAVFAAHYAGDPQRKAAVKVLVPVPGEQMAERRARIGRFHREALALRRLVHDNIVQLYDFARERDGSLYLAMERLEGPTLSTLLRQHGRLPPPAAVGLILPVLSAVGAAHKVGVIHRDLKPDNIVLATVGQGLQRRQIIKVVDFGVARLAGDTFTRTGQALGTPVYMAPEQANGADIDERVDIYGTAAVLYELLTGRPPFSVPDAPHANLAVLALVMTSEPRAPRELQPDVSPALSAVVLRALRRNREERYASAEEFAAALQEALARPEFIPWVPPPAEPSAEGGTGASLPSLGTDSLPGWTPLVAQGPAVQLPPRERPQPAPSAESPRPLVGESVPLAPATQPRSAAAPLTARLMTGLYLALVGVIAIGLVVDRLGVRTPPSSGGSAQLGQVPSGPPTLSPGLRPAGSAPAAPSCPAGMVPIPAGCFRMGSDDPAADIDERPPRWVCLSRGYCLDRTEVDNASYQRCVRQGGCRPPGRGLPRLRWADFLRPEQPVVMVSWQDAERYCRFVGKRLPTEAEWEYAARGPDSWLYPWGNEEPSCDSAIVGAYALPCTGQVPWCRAARQCLGRNPSHPAPPGSRPRDTSPFGVLDLAGNVSEWVADWYAEDYYATAPALDPAGPAQGRQRVYRGGSWGQMGAYVRASFRNRMDPTAPGDIGLGFRCAK